MRAKREEKRGGRGTAVEGERRNIQEKTTGGEEEKKKGPTWLFVVHHARWGQLACRDKEKVNKKKYEGRG